MQEVDRAVKDNFGKNSLGGKNLFDGAASGELETGTEAIFIKLGGRNPAKAMCGGMFENKWLERFALFGGELLGISKVW